MIIDVNANQLDAVFLTSSGILRDSFSIVHQAPPSSPPVAPDNLVTNAISSTDVLLSWNDNSDDESGFDLQRSTDQTNWTSVATPGTNTSSVTDTGLEPETTYHYRILAVNSVGHSSPSNVATATTDAVPPFVNYSAVAETAVNGTVSGNFSATEFNDDSVQSIRESESGGKPTKRRSLLEHRWQFSIQAGANVSVHANAWSSGSDDGDEFAFSFSIDGGKSWQALFTVESIDPDHQISALLPSGTGGTVLIRVIDTDRTRGHRALDTVYVDELRVQVSTMAGSPPTAPDVLVATSETAHSVELSWNDNATDETGYAVERRASGGDWITLGNLAADSTGMTDWTVAPETTYEYRVLSFNGFGNSSFSNIANVTTGSGTGSGIVLTASGQKIKGVIHANLSWDFAVGDTVDIVRDGSVIDTVSDTTYTDNTGAKGGATLVYKVCEYGSDIECSNDATVAF
ncbi:fibronectin type III domain-containing protein [Granulosicoccus sp. 3-233]|uniref:fibronectin type III domain-containing protein n=1 Tax=Granulosicoccus sp. 3-233 TaxID=3417969 RepID=UPI003D340592